MLIFSELIKVLSTELTQVDNNDFHRNNLKTCLKKFSTTNHLEFPKLMKLLRGHLSGLEVILKIFLFYLNTCKILFKFI